MKRFDEETTQTILLQILTDLRYTDEQVKNAIQSIRKYML